MFRESSRDTNILIKTTLHTHQKRKKKKGFSMKIMFVSYCIPNNQSKLKKNSIELMKFSKISMIQNLEEQVWLQICLEISYSNLLYGN